MVMASSSGAREALLGGLGAASEPGCRSQPEACSGLDPMLPRSEWYGKPSGLLRGVFSFSGPATSGGPVASS